MKTIILTLLSTILCFSLFSNDYMQPSYMGRHSTQQFIERNVTPEYARPDASRHSFSIMPETLLMSYYDYMIGSYNNCPLWRNPDQAIGGYYLVFHGQRTAQGLRRVFNAFIENDGTITNMSEIPENNQEGYPSIAIDPVTYHPFSAWHENNDTDAELEVVYSYNIMGIESWDETVIDNPVTIPPYNTTDNEFNWPSVQTGPSPAAGMRRVYVLARNFRTHTIAGSENVYIAYADYNTAMLEAETDLTWNYTSIPTLNDWNHDNNTFRRMAGAFVAGNDDKIYYIGYRTTSMITPVESELVEPDLDIFICDNYGEGIWARVTGSSVYPSWNPMLNYGNGPGYYFTGSDALTPVPPDSLFWSIKNSSHFNAVIDNYNNKINIAAIWAQQFREFSEGALNSYYHPSLQVVRNLVYDINSQSFSIREIYPVAGSSSDDLMALPWDVDGDGSVDEYFTNPDDPNDPSNGYPLLYSYWPFPHWDSTIHSDAMMYHYNNIKITQPDQYGNMACVWQDSNRARLFPTTSFADTPEIMISLSGDFGINWTEPISLNKVETPQLAGMKPMWVYPVNQVKGYGDGTGFNGKLAIMFYDDLSWGSFAIAGPIGLNNGGYVKFMELNFPLVSNLDEVEVPEVSLLKQNYPNPFISVTVISFLMPKTSKAELSIYNVKGQKVKTLTNNVLIKGEHSFVWNAQDEKDKKVTAGLYFCRLQVDGRTETRRMILLK